MVTVAGLVTFLERFAPPGLAADWDNVGLLLGDRAAPVRRVMTCLTLTEAVAAEAVREGVELVVTHHPILFQPVKRLTAETAEGRLISALLAGRVAVYSPHTAFDNCPGGINDLLAERFGLTDVRPLRPRHASGAGRPQKSKLVVFVPDGDLAKVSDAVFAAGGGEIGNYRECSFRLHGTGTFYGSDATNPTVGQKGRREDVAEWRLEVVCPQPRLGDVVAAVRRAHSYEEPAFDVYPLLDPSAAAADSGEGRIGRLPAPTTVRSLAEAVKTGLNARSVQYAGDPERVVRHLAVACGAAGGFVPDAVRHGADVLLTGEARFHDVLAADAAGLVMILPGHYASERFGVDGLASRLGTAWPGVQVWASRSESDPLTTV